MKSHTELVAEIEAMLLDPRIDADSMPMYFLKPTGDIIDDFYYFTHSQGGGLSNNPTDPYILGHENDISYWPNDGKKIIPWTDGYPYHTKDDVTWKTAKGIYPNITPMQFYTMDRTLRQGIVDYYIKAGKKTSNDACNILFSYCYWRTYHDEYKCYKDWYQADINKDIKNIGALVVFVRIVDIMIFKNSQISTVNENPGWIKGILCAYKLFKKYCIT